jgi:hypothetical protein
MAVLVYPLVDTLRIFIYRVVRGMSPFSADRNHLHHQLLDMGLGHAETVIVVYFFNIVIIGISLYLELLYIDPNYTLIIVASISLLSTQIPFFVRRRQNSILKGQDREQEECVVKSIVKENAK